MKILSRKQVEGRKRKAVSFTETMLGDPERAQEIEAESVEDYAERRGFQIENPFGRKTMPQTGPTKDELTDTLDQISDALEDALDPTLSREELVAKVQEIADLAAAEGDEDEGDEDDEGDETDED